MSNAWKICQNIIEGLCGTYLYSIREGQKSESMQKCIEVMDKMMKPNQNELDFWRCAVNQGPLYLYNGQNTQFVKYIVSRGGLEIVMREDSKNPISLLIPNIFLIFWGENTFVSI